MTRGPYKQGKNRMSAGRLNETDALARKPLRVGPGLRLENMATSQRLSLVPEKKQAIPAITGVVRYGYIKEVGGLEAPEQVLVQFLSSKTDVFGEPPNEVTRTQWSDAGEPRVAKVPANFRSADFALWIREAFNAQTPVMRIDRVDDNWIVSFEPRWSPRELPSRVSIVRCPR